jgi:hypothetical protein
MSDTKRLFPDLPDKTDSIHTNAASGPPPRVPEVVSQQSLGSLRLFPNTGFHQHFFPLVTVNEVQNSRKLLAHNAKIVFDEKKTCVNDQAMSPELVEKIIEALRRLVKTEPDWRNRSAITDQAPWLKAWYGIREIKVPLPNDPTQHRIYPIVGIWVAIETNLGSRQRGFVIRESSPPTDLEIRAADTGRQEVAPYVFENLASVKGSRKISVTIATDDSFFNFGHISLDWLTPAGEKAIDVDLIVDFGNTRSAVLALEHIAESPSLAPICKPVPFCSREETFDGYKDFAYGGTLADSWLLLKQPHFESGGNESLEISDWEFRQIQVTTGVWPLRKTATKLALDKVTYRAPQLFSALSPVLIGDAARRELLELDLTSGGKLFLSSPKRYAWDTDPSDNPGDDNWHMVRNGGHNREAAKLGIPKLECQMLRFMPADGSDWDIDNPPNQWPMHKRPVPSPKNPQYPRSDSLAWTALAILENAFRVINSEPWRSGTKPFTPRALRDIVVTYPSGWTAGEISAYRAKWQKAINVFCLTNYHSSNGEACPRLNLRLQMDEAVASQLPIVVSEIRKVGDDGNKWLNAIGRGERNNSRLRAMTIDIGGGTTDISIVEYSDRFVGKGVELDARVLFKDCNSAAGDQLRKMIIERVLLPRIIGNRENLNLDLLQAFLSGIQATLADYAKWSRFTRVLFLPIVNRWLSDLGRNQKEDFTMTDIFETNEDGTILDEFNAEARRRVGVDLLPATQSLGVVPHRNAIRECIKDCFGRRFLSLAKFVAAFECDLVIVSGKPSELPDIRSLLEEALPILPSRIIFALGYRCGAENWPLSSDGRVQDAKFVTVVGAALHQAIRSNLINNWSIDINEDRQAFSQNYWGVPDGTNLSPTILEPGQRQSRARLIIGSQIGRKLLPGDSRPEPIYVLRWRDPKLRRTPNCVMEIEFTRESASDGSESLQILRANGERRPLPGEPDGEMVAVTEEDIELKLCTLQDGGQYWLDTGRFQVDWNRRGEA